MVNIYTFYNFVTGIFSFLGKLMLISAICELFTLYIVYVGDTDKLIYLRGQWRNGRGAGGRVPPETSDREISTDLPGKKRQGKREKGWKLRRKEGKL